MNEQSIYIEMTDIKAALIEIERQLGDDARVPSDEASPAYASYLAWRSKARMAHSLKRSRLLALKKAIQQRELTRRERFASCRESYNPDDPRDLVVVAADALQSTMAQLSAHGESNDDAVAVLCDLKDFIAGSRNVVVP